MPSDADVARALTIHQYVQYSPSSFVAIEVLATRRLGPNLNQ
jgi:hypothetical protein